MKTNNFAIKPWIYAVCTAFSVIFLVSCRNMGDGDQSPETFKVMTFNLWHGGDAVELPRDTTVKYQLEAIRRSGAGVVGFQEQTTNQTDNQSRAQLLADSLGWNCHIIDGSRAVISRFGITALDDSGARQAVMLHLDGGTDVVFGVMHLMHTPYEPYDIADGILKNAAEAKSSARETRLHQVQGVLGELVPFSEYPTILVGDFNEPSTLDWTDEAIRRRDDPLLPFAVDWPATTLLKDYGFTDAYRAIYPDVTEKPGYTWTSVEGLWRQPEVHDRIDLILVSRYHFQVKAASIIGESSPISDIVVEPWPSDHRAVVAEIELLK